MSPSASSFAVLSPGARRADRRVRPALSRAEKFLVVLAALNLVAMVWAFGGVDVTSQVLAAGLGALALGAALWRPRDDRGTPWARLRRFPVFWTGLALFACVLVQAANPAFTYHLAGRTWWLESVPFIRWLPAGMTVPFADAGPWRQLLLWFSPWATVCALWIGLTQRATVLALLNVIAVNGFLLAAFGLVQLAAGQGDIYGVRHTEGAEIFASFIYRNHAAAYLQLVGTLAFALALHGLWRRHASEASRGPAILHFLFAVTAVSAIVLTFSFGGVLLLAGWILPVLVSGVWLLRARVRLFRPGPLVAVAVLALVGGLAAVSGSEGLRAHVQTRLAGGPFRSLHTRLLAAKQGFEMFRDRPVFGWGAGCFRYGFTKYQRREIEITGVGLSRHFWQHQHNDWLELLIELGIAGMLPVAVMAAFWLRELVRQRFWRRPFLLWSTAGIAIIAFYAWFDFPLQNPAVLLTTACMLCLVTRWAELTPAGEEPPPPATRRLRSLFPVAPLPSVS